MIQPCHQVEIQERYQKCIIYGCESRHFKKIICKFFYGHLVTGVVEKINKNCPHSLYFRGGIRGGGEDIFPFTFIPEPIEKRLEIFRNRSGYMYTGYSPVIFQQSRFTHNDNQLLHIYQ